MAWTAARELWFERLDLLAFASFFGFSYFEGMGRQLALGSGCGGCTVEKTCDQEVFKGRTSY